MKSPRILAFTGILIGIALGFSLSAGKSEPLPDVDREQVFDTAAIAIVDYDRINDYLGRQRELSIAIKAYFEQAIASGDLVGAGVSIVRGDSVLLSEGYGLRSSKGPGRVDGRTVFRLGSLSKGFTGVLAAKLVQDGSLNWDDPVNKYLPDFKLGNQKNTEKITLAHILSHSSGAPYHSFTNLIEARVPLPEIARHFGEVTPVDKPGGVYSYQNAIFALSGEMMLEATGKGIEELLEETFFNPLEMCATSTDHKALTSALNVALPHTRRYRGWRPGKLSDSYYNAIAAGGINASAHDMASWMQMLLGHRPEILDRTALAYTFTPIIEIPGHYKYYQRWPGHIASYYGLGWRIHKFREGESGPEKTIWHHGGSVNNFRNEIALYPESDLGICVLINSNSKVSRTVIPDLYAIVKGIYHEAGSHLAANSTPGFTY